MLKQLASIIVTTCSQQSDDGYRGLISLLLMFHTETTALLDVEL